MPPSLSPAVFSELEEEPDPLFGSAANLAALVTGSNGGSSEAGDGGPAAPAAPQAPQEQERMMVLRYPARRFVRPAGRTQKLLGMVQVLCVARESAPLAFAPTLALATTWHCLSVVCWGRAGCPVSWQWARACLPMPPNCQSPWNTPAAAVTPAAPCRAPSAVGLTAIFYVLVGLFGYLSFPTNAASNVLLNYSGGWGGLMSGVGVSGQSIESRSLDGWVSAGQVGWQHWLLGAPCRW